MEEQIVQEISPEEIKKQKNRERMAKARAARKPKPEKISAPAIHIDKRAKEEKVVFFTESDMGRNKETGEQFIKHQHPTWYGRKQKEDLKEEIRMLEKGIENKYFKPEDMGAMKEKLKKAQKLMDTIDETKPAFEKEKDTIKKVRDEAEAALAPTMYKRSDEKKGLVDAHELAELWSQPKIEVSNLVAQIARQNGIEVTNDRKMNQTNLTRVWQFARAALGESRNAEILRKD